MLDKNRLQQFFPPTVIEKVGRTERTYDIYSRLLKDRIIFLGTEINDEIANAVVAQLLFLDQQNSQEDIYLYINSGGGSVRDGLAIFDTMNYISANVSTICVGLAASMAAVLLANGALGKRSVLPHSTVMIHQPWGGSQGQVTDIEIATKEMLKIKKIITEILAEKTKRPLAKLKIELERDYWLNASQALKYGLVDNILKQQSAPASKPK